MSGLVRKKAGFVLSDFSNPEIKDKIPGAGHLRAALTTSTENLAQDAQRAEIMVSMLNQSLKWMAQAGASEIINRLAFQDQDEKLELTDVLNRHHDMYASDVRFSRRQIEATAQFMRAAGILADKTFDINTLIASQIAGVKP